MQQAEEMVVEEGVAVPEAQAENQEVNTQEQESQVAPEQSLQEDPQERNWRQTRQRIDELQQTIDRQDVMIRGFNQPATPSEPEMGSDWRNVDKTDVFDAGQAVKSTKDIVAEAIEQAFQKRSYDEAPKLIESEHADYQQVVTPENVERLRQTNPRLAASLAELKDPYAQGALAYSYIKSQGIYSEGNSANNKQRALSNAKKPLPVTALKSSNALESANAYSNGLTPDLKKNLWSEMQAAIRKG